MWFDFDVMHFLNIIYILKRFYDMGKKSVVDNFCIEWDEDDYLEPYIEGLYELLSNVFDDFEEYFSDDYYDCNEKYIFHDKCIDQFIKLSLEYGTKNNIERKNNPYLTKLKGYCRAELNGFSYVYDGGITWYQEEKLRGYGCIVLNRCFDGDDTNPLFVIEALLNIRDWLKTEFDILEKLVYETKYEVIAA